MKPAPFLYHRPESVSEAIELLSRLEDAKPLAGGQSLMPMMNFRYVTPANVVDLSRIAELSGITEDDGTVVIGAMTRQREVKDSALVAARCPLLADALHHVGHVQTRNRGTLGGSLAHLDPAAELPGVLLAHDAVLEVEGKEGVRSIPMSQWALGYMTPALEEGELLVRVRIPVVATGARVRFQRSRPTARRLRDGRGGRAGPDGRRARFDAAQSRLVGVDDGPVRLDAAESPAHRESPHSLDRLDAAAQDRARRPRHRGRARERRLSPEDRRGGDPPRARAGAGTGSSDRRPGRERPAAHRVSTSTAAFTNARCRCA